MKGKDAYPNVDDQAVLNDYYANEGSFHWKNSPKGSFGRWQLTIAQIKKRHGFRSDANVLDRVRRLGIGTRSKLMGQTVPGRKSNASRTVLAETNPDAVGRKFTLAKRAVSQHIVRTALQSPRALQTVHDVAKGLARALGTNSPSLQEVARYISDVTA